VTIAEGLIGERFDHRLTPDSRIKFVRRALETPGERRFLASTDDAW
jgi:hypothetical protein